MNRKMLYGVLMGGAVLLLCVVDPVGASQKDQLQISGEKRLFTKHFENTIFDITEHAEYSVEVLLDDKEYKKLGKNVIGVVIHNA
ncbi:MAG TPA: hypothetical protein VEI28_00625, partial [Thermodesulfovibrionales bacterium]|nr:hypothetical protein [Thermodesulfovibrionales bacterium]